MQRSKLKNIINKSKGISTIGESPFDKFKNSLPKELDSYKGDNYRLEAAWKAYGSPKDYNEAVWLGLVNPMIPGKMPSIGYNEESDEYEYLNTGKDNEIVAKDIRVWDNDVIPLVKELKLGGYIRTFNEEKNCWTYSKNPQKGTEPSENNELQVIEEFKLGGKTNEYELFLSVLPENLRTPTSDYNMKRYWELNGKPKTWFEALNKGMFSKEKDGFWHSGTVAFNENTGEYEFMKSPNHPTIYKELEWYNSPKGFEFAKEWLLVKPQDGSNYKYIRRTEAFKQGGLMTTIPSGSLHARKNGMELAEKGEITHKGVPVIDNEGNLQAEIERNEIIYSKSATDTIEKAYKKYNSDETSNAEKDELAIKIGKFLCKEILENTDDRTGIIEEIADKNNLEYSK